MEGKKSLPVVRLCHLLAPRDARRSRQTASRTPKQRNVQTDRAVQSLAGPENFRMLAAMHYQLRFLRKPQVRPLPCWQKKQKSSRTDLE